ncbi:hypothetical protein K4H28_13015 [Deefgea tanakiae]|jgi:hypothetical protein|uniref:Uncharacterized protein n=1 Tax=Deefgea tanakiae TaxID=2865840 RepID=A0ABX8Z3P5_9NEIS|nr:hypothetical protein [Deefgea tanakiae]QZA77197.1 hypothetical protein K4H28_13015 [Deefgea tanakiae]
MEKPEWFDWANDEKKAGEWIRSNNPEWFAQVCQLLFDHDPMMMTLVGEPEGYAPEVGSILRSLPQCMNVDDVQQLIFNVFTQWFTPEFAGGRSQYAEVAAAVWENWKQQQSEE